MAAEMDSQDSPSSVPGDQRKSPQLNPELLEESGSGKGKAIECEMAAETDRETDRNSQHQDSDSQHQDSHSQHQDSHSPVPDGQQKSKRKGESGSRNSKGIANKMASETHPDQYRRHQDSERRHQDSHSPVPGEQQENLECHGESGSGKRKQIKNKMASETDRYTDRYNRDQYSHGRHQDSRGRHQGSHSPVPVMFLCGGVQQKSPQLTLVLLGESGSGKSASGNTILGMKAFKSKPSSMPVTTKCETKTKSVFGTEVKVIDTPDLSDDSFQSKHIQECIQLCEGNLCVYLLVIQIGRFTEGERDILERLEKALQPRVRDRAIILFTRGDDLGSESEMDDYVRNTNPYLQDLIGKCGQRYQMISNTISHEREAEKQVKELMGKIGKLVQETDGEMIQNSSSSQNTMQRRVHVLSLNCCDHVNDSMK